MFFVMFRLDSRVVVGVLKFILMFLLRLKLMVGMGMFGMVKGLILRFFVMVRRGFSVFIMVVVGMLMGLMLLLRVK